MLGTILIVMDLYWISVQVFTSTISNAQSKHLHAALYAFFITIALWLIILEEWNITGLSPTGAMKSNGTLIMSAIFLFIEASDKWLERTKSYRLWQNGIDLVTENIVYCRPSIWWLISRGIQHSLLLIFWENITNTPAAKLGAAYRYKETVSSTYASILILSVAHLGKFQAKQSKNSVLYPENYFLKAANPVPFSSWLDQEIFFIRLKILPHIC